MLYIIGGLSIFIVSVLVKGILSLLRKPTESNKQIVILPKLLLVIGIICSGVLLLFCVFIFLENGTTTLMLLLVLISLLSSSLIVAYFNCRITYNKSGFTAKNFGDISVHIPIMKLQRFKANRKI